MNENILLSGWSFQLPMPIEFEDTHIRSTEYYSKYNTMGNKRSTLHAPMLYAILRYARVLYRDNIGGVGWINKEKCVAEYLPRDKNINSDYLYTVTYKKDAGKFQIQSFYYQGNVWKAEKNAKYSIGEQGHTGAALFFAMIPAALQDEEFSKYFKQFCNALMTMGGNDNNELEKAAYILCDNLYRRIMLAKQLGVEGLMVNLSKSGIIEPFTEEGLKKKEYSPIRILAGKFITIPVNVKFSLEDGLMIPHEKFSGKYKLDDRNFTPKEKQLIPKLELYYEIPSRIAFCCELIKNTKNSAMPVKNFLFRGESGTGKTAAAMAIANALDQPYVYMTCHENMEISDLLGHFVPYTPKRVTTEYPEFYHFIFEPSTAYQMLSGIYDDTVTEVQAYEMLIKTAERNGKQLTANGKQQFEFVESPLVKAMKNGYVVEIQEISALRPAVLIGLNALLDQCGSALLETGEVIQRHPNTIVIMTTNNDYAGCKVVNQSIISRAKVVNFEDLKKEDYINRGIKITNCTDRDLVERMADTMLKVKKHCKEKAITSGSCGMREFILWIQASMICNNPLEAAVETVLEAISDDEEVRTEVFDTCFKLYF